MKRHHAQKQMSAHFPRFGSAARGARLQVTAHLRARRCLPGGRTLSGTSICPKLAGLGEIVKVQRGEQQCERGGWLAERFLVPRRELPALRVREKQLCSF